MKISDFSPESEDVILDFLVFLRSHKYKFRFVEDFFTIEAENRVTGDEILIAEVTEQTSEYSINAIKGVSPATKVLFVDFEDREKFWFTLWGSISESFGAYVYELGVGWISEPSSHDTEALRRHLLEKTERFSVVDGELHKICRVCGSILPVTEFYRKPRSKAVNLDPYRNYCKACAKAGA